MLSYILNNCSMSKHIIILIAVAIIGFAVNENIVVTAQTNSTNSDKQKIVVTWLEQMIQRRATLQRLVLAMRILEDF